MSIWSDFIDSFRNTFGPYEDRYAYRTDFHEDGTPYERVIDYSDRSSAKANTAIWTDENGFNHE